MKSITRALLIACLVLPVIACGKKEEPQQAVVAPVAVPTTEDKTAWNAYLNDVAGRHMEGVNNSPYVYLVPPPADTEIDGAYERLLEKSEQDVGRGITRGNLLIFAGLNSARTADLVVATFAKAPPMNGVRVLFIGSAADSERVKAAVEPSGSEYVFIDTAA